MIAIVKEIMIMINIIISISTMIRLETVTPHTYHYYKYKRYIFNIQCVFFFMIEFILIFVI